ncbi:MAG: hypothetical protein ACPGWS_09250 [Solirubrobacterales bacterium]
MELIDVSWVRTYAQKIIPSIGDQVAAEELRLWLTDHEGNLGSPEAEIQRVRIVGGSLIRLGVPEVPAFPKRGPCSSYAEYRKALEISQRTHVELGWSASAVSDAKQGEWAFRNWLEPWAKPLRECAEIADALDRLGDDGDGAMLCELLTTFADLGRLVLARYRSNAIPWLPREGNHEHVGEAWAFMSRRLKHYAEAA